MLLYGIGFPVPMLYSTYQSNDELDRFCDLFSLKEDHGSESWSVVILHISGYWYIWCKTYHTTWWYCSYSPNVIVSVYQYFLLPTLLAGIIFILIKPYVLHKAYKCFHYVKTLNIEFSWLLWKWMHYALTHQLWLFWAGDTLILTWRYSCCSLCISTVTVW